MGGAYPTTMQGNAGFGKLDFTISPKQLAFLRLSTSRYSGTNNVFFDPSSPITTYAESANGTEDVKTESLAASLTSTWTNNLATTLRVQFSRDVQQSFANTEAPLTKIYDVIAGFGRSSILPRDTREHKLHIADTLSYDTRRMHWKFGGDFIQAWIYNDFPSMFGGEYYFDDVKVNPWTYAPMKHGEPLTPLRAFAHDVPRYYMQDFGSAVSHPNSRSYAAFMQDAIRVTARLTLNVGVRYDLQTFEAGTLITNPLYLPSGKIPTVSNNVSPRIGFAYATGEHQVAGDSRRLRPVLYADSVHVRVTGGDRQRSFRRPNLPRQHDPGTGGGFPQVSDAAGELPFGHAGMHAAGIDSEFRDHADFGFRAEFPDALYGASKPKPGARIRRQGRRLRQLSLRSRRASCCARST